MNCFYSSFTSCSSRSSSSTSSNICVNLIFDFTLFQFNFILIWFYYVYLSFAGGCNGLSPEIVPNLRIFTENWILRLQKADFDDLYTIGSEFASPTRSHTPFPAAFTKNAVSENFDCQILRKFSKQILLSITCI